METPAPLDEDACYRAVAARDARFDGRFFTCVKTTGIYCRPVCPARTPLRPNVTFVPSAAAAEQAGFRACLRCRPETAPDMGAWRGTSNTVARALALIEAGALDGAADVEALADRLGVGERQLRRLFRQHLGAAPVSVAQTRRVLLAKALIHESRLSMAEVALASGFGSVRRFNETFQRLYGRPPSALRRSAGGDAPEGGAARLSLRWRPPYDWAAMRRALEDRGEAFDAAGGWTGTVEGEGGGVVRVRPLGDDRLAVEASLGDLRRLPGVLARVRAVFDLAADPAVVAEHLSEDEALRPLIETRPGLRVAGPWATRSLDDEPVADAFAGSAAAVARAEQWRPWRAYAVAHLAAAGMTVEDLVEKEMRDVAA
jgi:AraC family transcriptional regulator of adaptative response / DNA-3-methyladenine glycosylase II